MAFECREKQRHAAERQRIEREIELDRELERRRDLEYRERLLRDRAWDRERERGGYMRDRPMDRDWDRPARYGREPLGLQMDRDDHEKAEIDWCALSPAVHTLPVCVVQQAALSLRWLCCDIC